MKIPAIAFKYGINIWPPYWGTGIHVDEIAKDFTYAKVSMKLKFYNRNYVGIHFGGSLYAMTDPFYMLLLLHRLGPKYRILDQSAHIEYIAPGKGKVHAEFHVDDALLEELKQKTASGEKLLHDFVINVLDEDNQTIARIVKTIYIRKRPPK